MNTEDDPRTAALRDLLVERAASSVNPRRTGMRRRALVATVAAFTLAGGLTGGAVSAVALTATSEQSATVTVDQILRDVVVGDAELLGTPISYTGAGATVIELGEVPKGATEFIYAVHCLDATSYMTYFDDDQHLGGTTTCDEETARTAFGGTSSSQVLIGGGLDTFTIETSGRFSVWGSWGRTPAPPEPSALQQASLEDGIVTQAEYRAGYERFAACMAEAGFPLGRVPMTDTLIQYATSQASETDGASPRCYTREFEDVDGAWQIANEDTSDASVLFAECLTALGITPAPTLVEKLEQLRAAGVEEPGLEC